MSTTPASPAAPKPQSFLVNVLWNWVAVAANVFASIFVTRYLIRQLGDERYGIWALTFSLIEYVFLFDLGFRSAVVTFVSRRRTQSDQQGINEIISTALAYFAVVALLVSGLTLGLAGHAFRLFQISEQYRADFSFLIQLVGMTWAIGIIASVFQASLEATQNFRTYSHIMVVILVLRSGGSAWLLYLGYGLREMGLLVVGCQCLGYLLMFLAFLRSYPEVRISRQFVNAATWKEMARYGIHSLITASGLLLLNQGPPVLIGHFRSEAFVGYYAVPTRLLQYIVDVVTRIGYVTVPKTSELLALGQTQQIVKLGVFINRYSLALFLPITIFLTLYGTELVVVWLGPTFAQQCGPLIPVFAMAVTLAVAAQFNSSQILFGMGVHRLYAKSLLVEAILMVTGMVLVLPGYGIFGAACVASALLVLNRGLVTPMMVCYHLKVNYLNYMANIYTRPLGTAIPVWVGVWWLRHSGVVPGKSFAELIAVGGVTVALYYGLCYFTCLDGEHRVMLWDMAKAKLRRT